MTSNSKMYGAIARNDIGTVQSLVVSDPSVLREFFLENSWLHLAAQLGRTDVMRALVEAGLAVDQLTSDGKRTPLDTAAGQGHFESCEWLLNHSADVNHGIGELATPIFSAIFSKSLALVELFTTRGADLSATFGNPSIDVMSYAERYGTPDILAFLRNKITRPSS